MINNSNLKETKNLNQTNIEPNGLMKAGLIITIVSSGFILFFALISLVYTLIGVGFWLTNVILAIFVIYHRLMTSTRSFLKKGQI